MVVSGLEVEPGGQGGGSVGQDRQRRPARGSGANTALRDAALLAGELAAAARGEKTLVQAIGAYERQMIDYGFAAVRAARAEPAAGVSSGPPGGW